MGALKDRSCQPTQKGHAPLATEAAKQLLAQLQDWKLDAQQQCISRGFKFNDFYQTMAFVNAVAWIANREDHHPELQVSYNRCVVQYRTHSVGGLSENDFICAAKIDALL